MRIEWILSALAGGLLIAGCESRPDNRPLTPEVFYDRRPLESAVGGPAEKIVPLPAATDTPDSAEPPQPADPVSQTVRQQVTDSPATRPATTRGVSSGQYMTVGGVIAEVNGSPIYANKILQPLESALAARARQLDEPQFRAAARDLIDKQIAELVRAELEFAAAQRSLGEEDHRLADHLTSQWRQRQITEAGGSLELARRRAAAEGNDFDDLARQQYRLHMTQVYYQKKIVPLIQVSAADMRRYYDQHREELFVEPDQARFRVIRIDFKKTGGREAAEAKIRRLKERIDAGADFAQVAGETNDDPFLFKSNGDVGWIQRGAYRVEKVEQAAWALQPGQVAGPEEADEAFFLVKLEERKLGRKMPFEDESMQDRIRGALRSEQFRALREKVQENLKRDAIIRVDEKMVSTALEMAMQRYPQWSARP